MAYFLLTKLNKETINFPIKKRITTLGRAAENDLVLDDNSVSAFHAHLLYQGGQYTLTDLKSRNGTLVAGRRIKSCVLSPGDEIIIGRFKLRFFLFSPELGKQLDEIAQMAKKAKFPVEYWSELKKVVLKLEQQLDGERRQVATLKGLLEVALVLNSYRKLSELLKTIMRLAVQVLSAERGFIMLRDKHQQLKVKAKEGLSENELKDTQEASISFSVVNKVVETKKPILITDTARDTEFSLKQSIIRAQIKSILCLPLLNRQTELLGVLYLDTTVASGLFSVEDLELTQSFANLAAVAIENTYLIEQEKQTALELMRLQEEKRYSAQLKKLEQEKKQLIKTIESYQFEELLGASRSIQQVFKTIDQVAKTDVPVLIQGETGTGKELVAAAIHKRSLRKDKPLVVINCGAIPENLLEAELFGYEKGAFTGAYTSRPGKFELAHGGSIFLDEIGELPLSLQVKLLRVLQTGEIERLGGQAHKIDVRIITATNKDLEKAAQEKLFREDLLYRVKVVSIFLPPLRERVDDIMLLANYFLTAAAQHFGKPIKGFTPEAKEAMLKYHWPGNIRELENKIKRAVVLAEGEYLSPLALELGQKEAPLGLKEIKEKAEIEAIQRALSKYAGNITHAARELKTSRRNLRLLIVKYNLDTHFATVITKPRC
jgi:transcriptional regulator with GAF, ATPase, and Fis domain